MLATLLPLCAGVVFTANTNPRALSPATLASLAGQVGAPAVDAASRPTRTARSRWRALAASWRAAGARRRRARDRLDLPHRRPRAPGRRRPRIDAVNREGPSALALIAAVARASSRS